MMPIVLHSRAKTANVEDSAEISMSLDVSELTERFGLFPEAFWFLLVHSICSIRGIHNDQRCHNGTCSGS